MSNKDNKNKLEEMINKKIDKYKKYDELENKIKKTTSSIVEKYFISEKIYKIAIYGMGVFGRKIYDLLENTRIEVLYGIDKNSNIKNEKIEVFSEVNVDQEIDAIVVTPIFDYDNIKRELCKKNNCKIISIEKIMDTTKITIKKLLYVFCSAIYIINNLIFLSYRIILLKNQYNDSCV